MLQPSQVPRLIVFPLLLTAAGCHTFFTVRGRVVDGSTGAPLPGANVSLVLDRGIGEPDLKATTGADGKLNLLINEPEGVWATLTVEHPNYGPWVTQFRGHPKNEIVVKMVPTRAMPATRPIR